MKPIAMKCSQEQFDKIKPKLKGMEITDSIFNLKEYPYLTNDYYNYDRQGLGSVNKHIIYGREIYEIWDEKIFLEACDIGLVESKTKITSVEIIGDIGDIVYFMENNTVVNSKIVSILITKNTDGLFVEYHIKGQRYALRNIYKSKEDLLKSL